MKAIVLLLMLFIGITGFSQDCPCVKTAIIGTTAKSSIIHNNKVVAMDDFEISLGETVILQTKENTGKVIWYRNGERLINNYVKPIGTTEYTVKSSLGDCPDAVDKVIIKVNDKTTKNANNVVIIYPNPAIDYVKVSSSKKGINSIHVSNLIGMSVLQRQYKSSRSELMLEISSLSSGIYNLTIKLEDNTTIIKKLIKN